MELPKTLTSFVAMLLSISLLSACGGGSSDSGMLIEGTLTEAGGASHDRYLILKHSAGQHIENVQICALGECSTTDAEGQWGFVAGENFTGGDVLFSVKGHGIDTTTTVTIPSGANQVFLDFQHIEGGEIEAEHITIDGETSHHEDDGHGHE